VGEERRPVLDAVGGLGQPFGAVLSGRFYGDGSSLPALVPFGDRVLLATGDAGAGSFRAVTLPDGEVRWGREYAGGAARGGLVADRLVVLLGGTRPSLVSFDSEDGDRVGCLAVPVAARGQGGTLLTDQAGRDVVVAAGPPGSPVTLSRVAPVPGSTAWDVRLAGVVEAGSLTATAGSVVVGRLPADPVRRTETAVAGGIERPTLAAYSLDDGSPVWRYPGPGAAADHAATVVGHDPSSGLLLVLSTAGPTQDAARTSLVALDDAGREVWQRPLGTGFWDASLWGDRVVAQGPDPRGGPRLRAFAVADGHPVWDVPSRAMPPQGKDPRQNVGAAVEVGDVFVAPAPNGLISVDRDGRVRRLDSEVAIDEVLPAGDVAVVRAGGALLVVGITR
jgi:outer membrane protein assembly factor BamB